MVVVDDIHLIDGHRSWQEALFHCYNRCAETGTPFLASATQSPAGLKNVLADLQSRLSLLTTFKLPAWDWMISSDCLAIWHMIAVCYLAMMLRATSPCEFSVDLWMR